MGSLKISLTLLISAALLAVVIVYMIGPMPQSPSYHDFADSRSWLGIPNAWNVLSNIAIALPGLWGLFLLLPLNKVQFNDYRERWLWLGVAIGLILTAVSSGYYHLVPDDSRLVWDRLSMTIVFMSLAAALISERVNIYLGLWLWPLLLSLGCVSVVLWYVGDDLRFYIGIQAFTILVVMVMLLLPSPYNCNAALLVAILCYVLAVRFDFFDHQVYRMTEGMISGHTLKHVVVGFVGACLIGMIWKRKKVKSL